MLEYQSHAEAFAALSAMNGTKLLPGDVWSRHLLILWCIMERLDLAHFAKGKLYGFLYDASLRSYQCRWIAIAFSAEDSSSPLAWGFMAATEERESY